MARIRSVHPGFFTDEDLVGTSLPARLLFIGLGIEADDKGIFEWKPITIKMRIFPADNVDVEALLSELVGSNSIRKFDENGKSFGAIRNFRKYQKPKTPNDIHPASAEILEFVGLVSETKPVKQKQFPQKGEKSPQMEEGGEDVEEVTPLTPRKRGNGKVSIPSDWKLPPVEDLPPKAQALAKQWPSDSYETHGEAFLCFWTADGRKYKDWNLVWVNRVVAIHEQVMRKVSQGNVQPIKRDPLSPQQ